MIEVSGLTKSYGSTPAVEGISFSVARGEVVGLLGPNGAGKTTTMKILTGYLPASAGTARLAGYEVSEESLEVRRRVGYLPESNPLYEEMEVVELLRFAGRLRGLDSGRGASQPLRERIREVVGLCGLGEVAGRTVGTLSKGYRQRVGFAQAILHDPEILVMDEPTSGLDPNQQREMRELIRRLKENKTVILSTHILPEVSETCDRVLIIHRGKIVADSTTARLTAESADGGTRYVVRLKAPEAEAREALAFLHGVSGVRPLTELGSDPAAFSLVCDPGTDPREDLFHLAVNRGWPILELRSEVADLDEVFRRLTADA